MVQENYRQIEARVAAACERAGRPREEVTLVAVSKTKPEDPPADGNRRPRLWRK